MKSREIFFNYFNKFAEETNQRIEGDINKYRKTFVILNLKDCSGRPIHNAIVHIKQKKHYFKFGSNLFMLDEFPDDERNEIYKREFKKFFNYGTLPFYWSDYEPIEGNKRRGINAEKIYRRPAPEKVLQFCRENNIEPKGHPLIWHSHLPDWLPHDREKAFWQIDRRLREISSEYGDKIKDWDVVNESLIAPLYSEMRLPMNYPYSVIKQAEKYFTHHRLFINELTEKVWGIEFKEHLTPFYMQLEKIRNEGMQIDCIGMQYHLFYEEKDLERMAEQYLNPRWLFAVLDRFADFKKPIQISEVTVPAYAGKDVSIEKHREYLEIQAEVTRWLFRIWFSHKNVESIIWWNLIDGTAAYGNIGTYEGENHWGGGLLDNNMMPKPVYHTINDLINREWHTDCTINCVNGEVEFSAFYGEYEISVEQCGKKTKFDLSLTPYSAKEFFKQI